VVSSVNGRVKLGISLVSHLDTFCPGFDRGQSVFLYFVPLSYGRVTLFPAFEFLRVVFRLPLTQKRSAKRGVIYSEIRRIYMESCGEGRLLTPEVVRDPVRLLLRHKY